MKKKKSSLKRVRQTERRRLQNRSHLSAMRTEVKKTMRVLSDEKTTAEIAIQAVQGAIQKIQKVASKGVIHRNQASRRVSRLMKKLNQFLARQGQSIPVTSG